MLIIRIFWREKSGPTEMRCLVEETGYSRAGPLSAIVIIGVLVLELPEQIQTASLAPFPMGGGLHVPRWGQRCTSWWNPSTVPLKMLLLWVSPAEPVGKREPPPSDQDTVTSEKLAWKGGLSWTTCGHRTKSYGNCIYQLAIHWARSPWTVTYHHVILWVALSKCGNTNNLNWKGPQKV